jgi:hypothetical protein
MDGYAICAGFKAKYYWEYSKLNAFFLSLFSIKKLFMDFIVGLLETFY